MKIKKTVTIGRDSDGEVSLKIEYNGKRLSICDVRRGQAIDRLEGLKSCLESFGMENVKRLIDVWRTWHLNDMLAGCIHQRDKGRKYSIGEKCPECGYRYGHAWNFESVPEDVLTFLVSLPSDGRTAEEIIRQEISDFIADHKLEMLAVSVMENPHMSDHDNPMAHYQVQITSKENGEAFTTFYSVGSLHVFKAAKKKFRGMGPIGSGIIKRTLNLNESQFCRVRNNDVREFLRAAQKHYTPSLPDVLNCLASDAGYIDSCANFAEWADTLGYDSDSIKAEEIYRACGQTYRNLERLLGSKALNVLLYETEKL